MKKNVGIEIMNCPFRMIGLVKEGCCTGCKPLEAIFLEAGLNLSDAKISSRNVLLAYAAVTLSDKARDDKFLVRVMARILRNRLGNFLPKDLNQYIISMDQKIATLEKFNATLEEYISTTGKAGEEIFNLAIPTGLNYNKILVSKAGSMSVQTMIMDDMEKDIIQDTKFGKYNPLKNRQVLTRFNKLYATTKERLKILITKIKIEHLGCNWQNIYRDEKGYCDECDVIIGGCIIYAIVAPILCYNWFPYKGCCCSYGFEYSGLYKIMQASSLIRIGVSIGFSDCCIPCLCSCAVCYLNAGAAEGLFDNQPPQGGGAR